MKQDKFQNVAVGQTVTFTNSDMKATNQNIGQTFKVRLLHYTSFRHYGGREIQTFSNIVDSTLVALQDGHQRYIVTLLNDCKDSKGRVLYKAGHKIAVCENDFAL